MADFTLHIGGNLSSYTRQAPQNGSLSQHLKVTFQAISKLEQL